MTAIRESNPLQEMSGKTLRSLGDTVASLPPRAATLVTMAELAARRGWRAARVPAGEARRVAMRDRRPGLVGALGQMGASRLYSHQLEAYERVRAGENGVVATARASGEALCRKSPAERQSG